MHMDYETKDQTIRRQSIEIAMLKSQVRTLEKKLTITKKAITILNRPMEKLEKILSSKDVVL